MARIRMAEGDITQAQVDAIVNAAATDLEMREGVARAIRERGGPAIQQECRRLGSIGIGEAVLTGGGDLPARYVIHAASQASDGSASEEAVRAATRRCLEIARDRALRSLAFPALGTGVGGLAMRSCAEIMLSEARRPVEDDSLEEIRFVLFGEPAYRIFEQVEDAEHIRMQMEKLKR